VVTGHDRSTPRGCRHVAPSSSSAEFFTATCWTPTPRAVSSASPTNFYLEAGAYSPDAIIASIDRGLLVTELIGFGVNPVTGDYSRGAAGLWIEHGEIVYPVEEITIAGNLLDMFRDIEMIGNDLEFRGSMAAPTLKISHMTIAGA
jgi:PmbA protein